MSAGGTEPQISQEARELQLLFARSPLGTAAVGPGAEILAVNDALCELLGFARHELVAMQIGDVIHLDDRPLDSELRGECLAGLRDRYDVDVRCVGADRQLQATRLRVLAVRDSANRLMHLLYLCLQGPPLAGATSALTAAELRDPMTGLPVSVLAHDRLAHALQRALREENGVAVLRCDIDGLTAVNERHGRDIGDEVIRGVAARIARSVRPGDTVSRLDGDDFMVIAEGISSIQEAYRMVERIRTTCALATEIRGASVTVALSVGLAYAYYDENTPAAELAARAESELLKEKARAGHL